MDILTKRTYDTDIVAPVNDIELILDTLWKDEDLQEAITTYGEWNGVELNKVFEIVKRKILDKYLDELLNDKGSIYDN